MEKLSLGRGVTPATANDVAGCSVRCPSCDHANPANSHFCNQCGMPVHFEACGRCDAINLRGATSCHKCGSSVPGSAIPETTTAAPAVVETLSTQAERPLGAKLRVATGGRRSCAASAARRYASRVDCSRRCLSGRSNLHRDGASRLISSCDRGYGTAGERCRRFAGPDFRATAAVVRWAAVGACQRPARSACCDIRSGRLGAASRRRTTLRDSPRRQEPDRRSIGCRGACRCEELESRDHEVERIAVQARHNLAQASNTQACDQGTLIPMLPSRARQLGHARLLWDRCGSRPSARAKPSLEQKRLPCILSFWNA